MSYLSDKIVQNVAKVTSFMSENLLNANVSVETDEILNANNNYVTSKLISSSNSLSTSSPELLIGFDANNLFDKFKSSFVKTKEFAGDISKLIKTTNDIVKFLEKNSNDLYSNLSLFSQLIKSSARQDMNSCNLNNYEYMQSTTNKVIDALSELVLKTTEKSDDIDAVQNRLLCLLNSLIKFVNLYKSLSGLFTKQIESKSDLNIQNNLIDLLVHINVNKKNVKKYINTTSNLVNVLQEIDEIEIENYLKELSANNNLFNEECYHFQPSCNWKFLYDISLNIKENITSDPYVKFVMNKIENGEISLESLKHKVNKMQVLYNKHLYLIEKYKDKISKANNLHYKKYNALSQTISKIKNREQNKYSNLISILSIKVSTFNIIGSTIGISAAILNLSYDMIKLGHGLQDTLEKLTSLVCAGITYIISILVKIIMVVLNIIYTIFGNLVSLTTSLVCFTINTIFQISFTLFMYTLFPIVNLPICEVTINYILILSKIFSFNLFMLKI